MKASAKRRRSKLQIKEEKEREELEKAAITKKLARFEEMEQQLVQAEAKIQETESVRTHVQQLYDKQILVENPSGEIQVNITPEME